ncbi:MAG TPA: hypothetical protein QGF02_02645 [Candidatus Babeliales bacterium]|nr:hypothetical protein [Candidatus Babeliales bacterium]
MKKSILLLSFLSIATFQTHSFSESEMLIIALLNAKNVNKEPDLIKIATHIGGYNLLNRGLEQLEPSISTRLTTGACATDIILAVMETIKEKSL